MSENMTPTPGPEPNGASAWYRAAGARPAPPPSGRPAPPPPAPPVQPERRHRRMKTVTLTVCAVLLCAAAVFAVWKTGLAQRFDEALEARVYRFDTGGPDVGFGFEIGPDADGGGTERGESQPADGYEDFREYFDNYYTGTNEITMPVAPTGTGVTLQLHAQKGEELSLQEIYARVSPAVVGITTYVEGEKYAWGTGVVFDSDTGYIVTNTHILEGCDCARIVLTDGREMEARLVGADEISDIAVIQVDSTDLPHAEFGRSATLRVGDTVVAIGNPISQDYTGTMTNGIISAIDRNVTYDGHEMTLLQTNAALNEGNSGGPLINAEGQVIGITNMKIMSSYFTTVEGIGFAIPSSMVKQIADQLIANGVVPGEPTIGIVAGTVSAEARELFDMPEGLYVTEVSLGSDALEKGLLAGDVITAVDGLPVSSVAQINVIKDGLSVGDTITLSVWRDGEQFELEIALVDKGDIQ